MEARDVEQVVEDAELAEVEEGTGRHALMSERKRQQSGQRGARGREIQTVRVLCFHLCFFLRNVSWHLKQHLDHEAPRHLRANSFFKRHLN